MTSRPPLTDLPEQTVDALRVRCGPEECPSPHSFGNKLARAAWGVVWFCWFRPTPKQWHPWRLLLLRMFGAKIARGVKIFPSVRIWAPWNLTMDEGSTLSVRVDCYCVAHVKIGACATVSQEALLCTATHDPADPHMRLLASPIAVEDQAWVCARAFIGPGVKIGQGAIAGAMAVVMKDVSAWSIVAGNPAREIGQRQLRRDSEP